MLIIDFKRKIRVLFFIVKRKLAYWRFSALNDFSNYRIVSAKDTYNKICFSLAMDTPFSFLRFGDGDVYLYSGYEDSNQNFNKPMMVEYDQAFNLVGSEVYKTLPIHSKIFGFDKGMKEGVHLQSDRVSLELLGLSYRCFENNKIYSPVFLHHLLVEDPTSFIHFMKQISKLRPIFVGGEQNNIEILSRLMNVSCFIKTPSRNAYDSIDEIETEIQETIYRQKSKLVVFACGGTAKILTKRLHGKGLQLFDIGSVIDVFHGRDNWDWVKISDIDSKYTEDLLIEIGNR
ncbi:GT-D fold domain-containing protein [Vibrio splendidus]|uniref:GT-D fold domain-containing glycosyltransferase n=1 Tax=Vibrio splendidus TaxID=29497 RepID=UPI001FB2DDC5|nr:GT-D fold domain-containing glycosyltransferase [Vibrio splendidus]UOE80918.1 GT-D fold domain-containing protein [Vibrio splendidus]